MSRVTGVTAADFAREVLFSPVPVVVDVSADWCGPCRVLAPILEGLAEGYAGAIRFFTVNADEEPDVVALYRVWGLPTLLLFKGGQEVDRVIGFPAVPDLTARLDGLAGRPATRPGAGDRDAETATRNGRTVR